MTSFFGEDYSMEVTANVGSTSVGHASPNYDCDTIKLQDWAKFKRCLGERAVRFLKDPELQYVAVKNVSPSDIDQIDHLRSCGELPQMRIMYDEEKRLMIVKLMPGVPHEVASTLFREIFRELVPPSIGIVGIGSARFGEASRRHKEPDASYMDKRRRENPGFWPSLVLEVGVSESLPQLRRAARHWLTESAGQVFVVILIPIGLSTGEVIWERWENAPFAGPILRSRRNLQPTLMQTVTLPAGGGPVIGAPFQIASNKIWDIVPNNVGPEIVFTAAQLEYFSREMREYIR